MSVNNIGVNYNNLNEAYLRQNNQVSDAVSFSHNGESETYDTYNNVQEQENIQNEEKVSFKEAISIMGKGFLNKIKNMATSIVKHPVKTLLAVGATSLLIAAAPIVGVTTATAGAVLALGFAAYAVGKTTKDVVETVKDNKEGRYDEVRQDLTELGGDGVDLALSLPFAPKAIKQVSRFAKYGKGTLGLNTKLLSNLKKCRSYSDVSLEFAKADTLANYEMIGNEMGLKVKPEIEFMNMNIDKGAIGGAYEPTTGKLQINENILTGKGKYMLKAGGIKNAEVILRHELEHFRQFSDVVRTENIGIEGLSASITDYYNAILEKKIPISELEQSGLSGDTINNMTAGDKSVFNKDFYQRVIDERGIIKAGTEEAKMSAKYIDGLLEKVNPNPDTIAAIEQEVKAAKLSSRDAELKLYKENGLEKDAYAAQDAYTKNVLKCRPGAVNDAIMADATIEEYFSDDDASLINPDKSLYAKLRKNS